MCVCVLHACTYVCVSVCNVVVVVQGTQKSIDKARELIDEVLSRPDKEYEAAKHQLGHTSGHYQQQNRSYEVKQDTCIYSGYSNTGILSQMGGGNYQQGPAWSSGGSKRHSTCVPPQRAQMIGGSTGGMPIPTKRTSLPATMKPSAAQLEVPLHHYSRSPSPSSIMQRVSPSSISPCRLSPVDPNVMLSGNNVILNVNNAEFPHNGVLNASGTMYGSSGSLHKTPSPNSLSPRKLSPSGYSTPPHDLVHLSISPAQRKYSPTVPTIFSPDDMLGCSSDGSSSVTLIRSKSVSPQPGFPAAVEQFTEERNAYNLQYVSYCSSLSVCLCVCVCVCMCVCVCVCVCVYVHVYESKRMYYVHTYIKHVPYSGKVWWG